MPGDTPALVDLKMTTETTNPASTASPPQNTDGSQGSTPQNPNPGSAIDAPLESDELSFVESLNQNFDADISDEPATPVAAPVAPQASPQQPAVTPPQQAAPQIQQASPAEVPAQSPGVQQQPAQATQQGAPAAPAATQQPAALVTPQAAPPAPQGQPQPQSAQAPAVPENPLQDLKQAMEQQRENFVKSAAQTYVNTFSDDDIGALQGGEPAQAKQVVATMAARLHADIVQNVLGIVAQQVPLMVQRAQVVTQQAQRASDDFYQQYPDLRAHDAAVRSMAAGLRQANPNMPQEQFMPMLVSMARMYVGGQQPTAPVAPTQPVQQQQPQVVPQPAFQPAPARPAPRGAFTGQQPAANGQTNWGFVDQIVEAEERGLFEPR